MAGVLGKADEAGGGEEEGDELGALEQDLGGHGLGNGGGVGGGCRGG